MPTFETMRAELTGEPSPGTVTVEIRWTHCLAPMWSRTLSEALADWEAERGEQLAKGILNEIYDDEDLARAEARLTEPWHAGESAREYVEHVRANLGKPKWSSVEEYIGERPSADEGTLYTPEDWPPPEERGYVVYETVSEGTPITPCFATQEELIDWLAEKGTAWDDPMPREVAERFVRGSGWLPSVIVTSEGVVRSGLEVAQLLREKEEEPES